MSLLARGLALQGFLLSPIAIAVQGLLAGGDVVLPLPEPAPTFRRRASAASTRGTHISLSDYIKAQNKRKPLQIVDVMLQNQEQEKKRRALRQRKQHRVAALSMAALPE